MSIADDIDSTHNDLLQAIESLVQTQFHIVQIAAQGNLAFVAALNALAHTIAAPRYLTQDASGNPVGVSTSPSQQSQ